MRAPATMLLRLLALVGKELVEVIRRPGALVSLVLGPFLIMAVFGLGYNGFRRPLETVVVIPPASGLPTDAATTRTSPAAGLHISGRGPRRGGRRAGLADGSDGRRRGRAGRRPGRSSRPASSRSSRSMVNTVDPIRANYAGFLAGEPRRTPSTRRSSARPSSEGEGLAAQAGQPDAAKIPPEVVAAPTKAELEQHRAVRAAGPRLLRAGRPRADPPAPRGHAGRPRARARADERRHRAVPGGAGERLGGHGRQGPGLPAHRRADRGRDRGPARRRVPDPDARRSGRRWRPRSGSSCSPRWGSGWSSPSSPTRSARPSSCRCCCCSRRSSSAASCWPSRSSPSRSGCSPTCCR